MEIEVLREVYRIVEWRDNSIYQTEYVEDRWVDPEEIPPTDHQFVVKSTDYEGKTIRRKVVR